MRRFSIEQPTQSWFGQSPFDTQRVNDVLRDRGVGCALLLRVLVPAGLGRRQRTYGIPLQPGTPYILLDI